MRKISGIGVAEGIVIGQAHVRQSGEAEVPRYRIPTKEAKAEAARFDAALAECVPTLMYYKHKRAACPAPPKSCRSLICIVHCWMTQKSAPNRTRAFYAVILMPNGLERAGGFYSGKFSACKGCLFS